MNPLIVLSSHAADSFEVELQQTLADMGFGVAVVSELPSSTVVNLVLVFSRDHAGSFESIFKAKNIAVKGLAYVFINPVATIQEHEEANLWTIVGDVTVMQVICKIEKILGLPDVSEMQESVVVDHSAELEELRHELDQKKLELEHLTQKLKDHETNLSKEIHKKEEIRHLAEKLLHVAQ